MSDVNLDTTRTVVLERDHHAAVLSRLREMTTSGVLVPVGEAQAPSGIDPPFLVLYAIGGPPFDGPGMDPEADARWSFQVTCVGRTSGEALHLADKTRTTLVRASIVVPGRRTLWIHTYGPSGAPRDDSVTPPVFTAFPRFELATTPLT